MKKILLLLLLATMIISQSCKKTASEETGKDDVTIELPEAPSIGYGTEWAHAGLASQIPSDDPDFSVTGKGFEYRGGYLGTGADGYFDLAVTYEPGDDESYTFEFSYYAKDAGSLMLGFRLYDVSCKNGDGMPGEWIRLYNGKVEYGGKTYDAAGDGAVRITLTAAKNGFSVQADGKKLFSESGKSGNGGAVKLYSEKAPVYITGAAFKRGI